MDYDVAILPSLFATLTTYYIYLHDDPVVLLVASMSGQEHGELHRVPSGSNLRTHCMGGTTRTRLLEGIVEHDSENVPPFPARTVINELPCNRKNAQTYVPQRGFLCYSVVTNAASEKAKGKQTLQGHMWQGA